VALVERKAMGGDCLNVGCVPSKALLEFTRRHPSRASFDSAFAWMREVRAGIAAHDSVQRYTENGVDVFLGDAQFIDDATLQVHDQQLRGRRFVIATGARPMVPGIPGLRETEPLTNESIFELEQAPASLAIIGAGPIGCELAQALARMGIDIALLDVASRVLPAEAPEASAAVMNALLREGVEPHLSARISRVERLRGEIRIELDGGELRAKRVLVAAGRQANVENLNLDAAGVELTQTGLVKVDERLRTTNSKIYAAGDVCSRLQFTHHADAQARVVIQNALFLPTARADRLVIPHCTYTTPEVAHVGATTSALEEQRVEFTRYAVKLGELDRGRAAGDVEDYAELLIRPRDGSILGATIVAENAGELIVPICVAMSNGLGLRELGKTVFPYPTRSEYMRRLADSYNRTRLTPTVGKLLRAWLRLID
jgi:pyruvate/2-oxoglutarate dehydrogenase complex dihydrolipoamide dehydrogenase (E3) component